MGLQAVIMKPVSFWVLVIRLVLQFCSDIAVPVTIRPILAMLKCLPSHNQCCLLTYYFQCASKVNGGKYGTTKDYPDEAIRFARSHPLMYQSISPAHKKPILVKTDGKYNLKQIAVDRVEAEDGQYDVLFIGTGKR